MMAFKCDICGNLYERYKKIPERGCFNSFKLLFRNERNEITNSSTLYDMCPNCMEDLWKFIDNKKPITDVKGVETK